MIFVDGVAAIGLGMLGLHKIDRKPTLKGRRLAWAGIMLGLAGLGMGVRCYTL